MKDMTDAIHYIKWTLSNSPKTYLLHREALNELREIIVNHEIKQREREEQ